MNLRWWNEISLIIEAQEKALHAGLQIWLNWKHNQYNTELSQKFYTNVGRKENNINKRKASRKKIICIWEIPF